MELGVEQSSADDANLEPDAFDVPAFGTVSLVWFDFSKKYCGALFSLSPESSRKIAEALGLTANFEHSGIRTAIVDLIETEANCTLDIERNAKPADVAVRYSRERWSQIESSAQSTTKVKQWIKTEYRARELSEQVIGLVAEVLRLKAENAGNFVIRIDLKDNTFGLICEERYAEQMPHGGSSSFSLPTGPMLIRAQACGMLEYSASEETTMAMIAARNEVEKAAQKQANTNATSADSESANRFELEERESAAAANGKEATAQSTDAAKDMKTESAVKTDTTAKRADATNADNAKQETLVEKSKQEQRREPVESSSAKYATYSRSEVDQMLKQQTESVATALGAKISSQQRVFQEATERQEKAFAKLSDGFIAQFDQTRVRLETASKTSEQAIHTELEAFKRDLSKELEQYRAQINKTVVPVAKFIEEKNAKPAEKVQKEIASPKASVAAASSADNNGIRAMIFVNLAIMCLLLAATFMIFMPAVTKVQEIETKLDSMSTSLSNISSASSKGAADSAKPSGAVVTPVSH